MTESVDRQPSTILTPDQRLRIFVSSTLRELEEERRAVERSIRSLRMSPVMFEIGARPHPPRDLYRSYLEQSHIFVGIYWESYGWIADDMTISGLEDEYRLSAGMPRLVYVKEPGPKRDPRLSALLEEMATAGMRYRVFTSADELEHLIGDDLAVLLTERSGIFVPDSTVDESMPDARLPVPASTFVGRASEVASVIDLLTGDDVRLVTLLGTGGIGKSRLALEIARRVAPSFPDGVVPVWLDSISDPALVLKSIASELGVRDSGDRSLLDHVCDRLRDKTVLLLLDNFEHILPAAGEITTILSETDRVKMLVTSRALLQVRGEHVVDVGPLSSEGEISDAAILFLDRARAVAPGLRETPETLAAVREIIDAVDGVPLALELAAARVRALSPADIARRLKDRLDLLKSGARDLPARQQTLRDTVRWSYELLDAEEATLFRRLSAFAGGADLEAIERVVGSTVTDPLQTVASLVDKSLLLRLEQGAGTIRFAMLSMIKEYAAERLVESGDVDDARERHADHYYRFGLRAANEMWSPEEPMWLDSLELDHENLQIALAWLVERGRVDDAHRLATALRWFWWIRGHVGTGDRWLGRVLAMEAGDPIARGRALVAAGALTIDLGDLERGRTLLSDAIDILSTQGDEEGLAWAHTALGSVLHALGDADTSADLQREALDTFDRVGVPLGQCTASTSLAALAWGRGEYANAESHYLHSLAARRQLGDPWGTAYVLTALGWTRILQGDLDGASEYLDEALPLFRTVRFRDGIANATDSLGYVAAARGQWDEAKDRFSEALRLFQEVGKRPAIALDLSRIGRAELARGNVGDAARLALEGFELADDVRDRGIWTFAVETAACVLAAVDRFRDAARLFGATDCARRKHKVLDEKSLPLGRTPYEESARATLGEAYTTEWALGCELDDAHLRTLIVVALREIAALGPTDSESALLKKTLGA